MKRLRHIFLLVFLAANVIAAVSCDPEEYKIPVALPDTEDSDNTDFVMLFTNDFHSQIEPTDDGKGGVLRLKALVDSVRTAEPYVLLADAGDLVQGTYYFSLLNGVVEEVLDTAYYLFCFCWLLCLAPERCFEFLLLFL